MSDQVGGYLGSSYGLRPGDYRRVWNAGNTIGRAARNYLMRKPTQPMSRDTRKRSRAVEKVRRSLRAKRPLRHDPAPKISRGVQIPEGHGHSLSKVFLGSSGLPKSLQTMYNTLAEQRYVSVPAGVQYTAGLGLQTQFSPTMIANYGDINAMNTASGINGEVAKMFLESFSGNLEMANSSAGAAVIIIYDCISRRDVASSSIYTPSNAWAAGISNEGVSNGATNVGSVPFESDLFTQFWKVVKQTKIILASGEVHKHCFSMTPKQLLHTSYVATYGTYGNFRDLTYCPLVVVHGMPVHDSGTLTAVTSGAIDLDVTNNVTYSYRLPQQNVINWFHTNNLVTTLANGQQEFNEAVGQEQDSSGLHPTVLVS